MIRDRLVAGLLDTSLSERLQLELYLMLQDSIKCAQNSAAVKQEQAMVCAAANGTQTTVAINVMQSHPILITNSFAATNLPPGESSK